MTLKMKADIKQEWIDALRSGEFKQGAGDLHQVRPIGVGGEIEERFCCLGILSVMCKNAGAVTSNEAERVGTVVAYGEKGETAYLPTEVIAWAGLEYTGKRTFQGSGVEEVRGIIDIGTKKKNFHDEINLSRMNDTGASFEEIADVIEQQVVGV